VIKKLRFAIHLIVLFTGCSSDVERTVDGCTTIIDGTICTIKNDSSIVARCENEKCIPFGCDICPRLPCQNIACTDDVCHQTPIDDGSACVGFPDPLAASGIVGTCDNGQCTGSVMCTGSECPMVECMTTSCNEKGICVGFSVLPGTNCTTANGKLGSCFNYTCTEPSNNQ
jgi:hypothetical protein